MAHREKFAAYIGLDWAQQAHAVCICPAAGGPAKQGEIKQTPEAIAAWVAELRAQFDGRPVAICLELARGALVYALMQHDFLTLYPINPKQLAAFRAALCPSGAKDDPTDAELLARFLRAGLAADDRAASQMGPGPRGPDERTRSSPAGKLRPGAGIQRVQAAGRALSVAAGEIPLAARVATGLAQAA
jgi:hypothetical protein